MTRAGIPVTMEDIQILVDRTEGWPAGVSLAALWLAGISEPQNGIRQFSATHRHIADYLATEVLETVDDAERDFLLRTSVFDRFSATACDAVLGTTNAERMLADLERSNLFLVALDARGDWYRYHHLFRELLRIELAGTRPEITQDLHRRAADWFHANGLVEEALAHAAAVSHDDLAPLLGAEHLRLIRAGKIDVLMHYARPPVRRRARAAPDGRGRGRDRGGIVGTVDGQAKATGGHRRGTSRQASEAEQRYVELVVALSRASFLDQEPRAHAREREPLRRAGAAACRRPPCDHAAVLAYATYLQGDSTAARVAVEEGLATRMAATAARLHLRACGARPPRVRGGPPADRRGRGTRDRDRGLDSSVSRGSGLPGIAHHALGQALLQLGRVQEAERELERAEVLRRCRTRVSTTRIRSWSWRRPDARGRLTLAATELAAAREHLDGFADVARLSVSPTTWSVRLDEAHAGSPKAVEPPSPAELAVLRLLATDLTQREIGSELFLSMNTVKTHTRNLYGKLGVSSREEAVHQANVLGLIVSDDSPG